MKRLTYLDYLRGLAIVLMIINHVGHYLIAQPLSSYAIYFSVYLTVTLAAPLFLFIAGFSLAAVKQKALDLNQKLNFKYFVRRGLIIIAAGILINVCFYLKEEPWYFGRILLVIGTGIMVSYPLLKYFNTKRSQLLALGLIIGLILSYPLTYRYLTEATIKSTIFTKIAFGEFSLYPWVLLLLSGVVAGQYFLSLTLVAQQRLVRRLSLVIVVCFVIWLALSVLLGHYLLFSFNYDFSLNGFWLPSNLTWLWIFGCIMLLFSVMFNLRDRDYFWLRGLRVLGVNALAIYFLQFFIIKTIGGEWLSIRLTDFYATAAADLIIILSLCYLVKSKTFVALMALNPLKAKAKIS